MIIISSNTEIARSLSLGTQCFIARVNNCITREKASSSWLLVGCAVGVFSTTTQVIARAEQGIVVVDVSVHDSVLCVTPRMRVSAKLRFSLSK